MNSSPDGSVTIGTMPPLASTLSLAANAPLILVVEDDARMRKYLRTTLAEQRLPRGGDGNRHRGPRSGTSAHNPDLVVLDLTIPDIDGVQVTMRLREWSTAPILILSARDDQFDKVAVLDAGANDYLTKTVRERRTPGAHSGMAATHAASARRLADSRPRCGRPTHRLRPAPRLRQGTRGTSHPDAVQALRDDDAECGPGPHPRANLICRLGAFVHARNAIPSRLHGAAASQIRK